MKKCVIACAAIAGLAMSASADPFSLTDGTSTVNGATGPSGTATGAPDLLSDFFVANGTGSTDVLFEANIFADDGTGAVNITGLPTLSEVVGANSITTTFDGGTYELDLTFDLNGNLLTESVTIRATSDVNLRLWEYTDFDVDGSGGDVATLNGPGSISQIDTFSGFIASAIVTSGAPDAFEIGGFNAITAPGSGLDLANTDIGGEGDRVFAFQWNFDLLNGETAGFTKEYGVVIPAPGSIALLGAAGVLGFRRRR